MLKATRRANKNAAGNLRSFRHWKSSAPPQKRRQQSSTLGTNPLQRKMQAFLGEAPSEAQGVDVDSDFVYALIEEYYTPAGIKPSIRHRRIMKVLLDIREGFPFGCTLAEASPFKKAAAFTCDFVLKEPIITPLPSGSVTDEIIEIPNHQNAVIALELSCLMLHGGTLNHSENGKIVTIEGGIDMSTHFQTDLIDFIADPYSSRNPRGLSLIYESLVYKNIQNEHIPYKKK